MARRYSQQLAVAALLAIVAACSRLEDPTGIILSDVIQLRVTGPSSIRADGVSTTTFQATVPVEATTRAVKFTTTRGTFQGTDGKQEITVTADPQGLATATLIAGREPAVANISASVGTTYIAAINYTLLPANADKITSETTSAFASLDGATKPVISAFLQRSSGNVSLGTHVMFEAFQQGADSVSRPVGRFFGTTVTDATGKATATFTVDTKDASTERLVVIRITAPTDTGGTVSTELPLRVQ